jgi:ABC-2 type transport system permease protein
MSQELVGTTALLRLAVRRDRWLIPLVVLGFSATAGFSASATAGLYPDEAQRVSAAEVVNATPAIVALYGPVQDPTSLGSLALFKLTALGAAVVALLMIVLVVRHSRAEEEAGRLELVGAGVVGRQAPLIAALLTAALTCLLLGVVTTVGLVAASLPVAGSVAFGAGWAATGLCFAAVAGVAAQVTVSGRAAIGLSLSVVGVAYGLRAVGDISDLSPGWASWVSPIGWNQQVRAFAGEQWAVLLLPLVATAALVPAALVLRSRRDLGSGLLAVRPGPAAGSLSTPLSLAWRLQRATLFAWTVALTVLGALLGTIAHTVESLLDSPGIAKVIAQLGGEQALTDAYLATAMGVVGILAAAYGVTASERLRKEETLGHVEVVLSTAVTRRRWAASHFGLALAGVAWLLLLASLAAGIADAVATSDAGQVARLVAAGLGQVPAAWVLVGLVVATYGLLPKATVAVWGLFAAFVLVGQLGRLWGVPQAVMDLSPFTHSPLLPSPTPDLTGALWLLGAAVLLLAVGSVAFSRRDLAP